MREHRRCAPHHTALLLGSLLLFPAGPAAAACRTSTVRDVPITSCTKPGPPFDAIRNELIETVRRGDIPSASIGVISGGSIVWEEAIGWSDREKKTPATPDTAYLLASMGKSVTATALMTLVERGKVDLKAPVSGYLGGVKLTVYEGAEEDVTVERVLDMTAEIPHGGLAYSSLAARNQLSTASLVRNRAMVVFPPGQISMYSNMNYAVVEQMIESVSGKSYRDFLHDALFAPLEMRHSWAGPARAESALRYDANGKLLPPTYSVPESSLSMYSTVDDLLHYASLHLGLEERPLLREETLRIMDTHRSSVEHAPMALGIGRVDLQPGRILLLTNGQAGGAQSSLVMLPDRKSAAICLINATGRRADDIVFRIAEVLSPGVQGEIQTRISAYQATANRPFQQTPELAGRWQGRIVTNRARLPIMINFQPDGDVHVKVGDQRETLIDGLAYDEFLLQGSFISEVPVEEEPGHAHPVRIALRQAGTRLSGFVTSDFINERGSFSLPSYVSLEKVKDQ